MSPVTPTTRDRKGFTIVELLVVSVLGSLLLISIYQILVTNQRTYREQADEVREQQNLRMAADILTNELREVSTEGSDITAGTSSSLTFRTPDEIGIVCVDVDTTATPVVAGVLKYEDWFEDGDSAMVFADNDPGLTDDDAWIPVLVTSIDTTTACNGRPAQELEFTGQKDLFIADTVLAGAPVRSFHHLGYQTMTSGGETWLARRVDSGSWTPIVGPLGGGVFQYFDADGTSTSATTAVRVQITLISENLSDTVAVRVFPRN